MYMAPEVFRSEPYADTADTFSFGVIAYELFTRTMLVFSQFPNHVVDLQAPERYAKKVAGGYRPVRTSAISDDVWALIGRCWAQDPVERPSMASVVTTLEELLAKCKAAGGSPAPPPSCSIM
jgi:serine/threonine protein kinase